ncbi:hypothetical protein [uncultured Lacinutrix sp.]|uniref:hypothetical protein n=1 Tax=uncultured Lacinutrix sp. TaxID=574032 RepID=UPI00260F15AD|nr:hypothetical protein [uncultured Lacinutrix sp.]
MRFKLKRNNKIGLFFFMAFVISLTLIYVFEEQFDKNTWQTDPLTRYKMVDDIIEKRVFIGKTKQEIISLLGEPYEIKSSESNYFIYKVGTPPSFFKTKKQFLLIVFNNQEVVKVSQAEE